TCGPDYVAPIRPLFADNVIEAFESLAGICYVIVNKTYCTPKFSISGLLEGMCKRPDMYTPHGTFDEVMADLNGFFSGIHLCREAPDEAAVTSRNFGRFFSEILAAFPA